MNNRFILWTIVFAAGFASVAVVADLFNSTLLWIGYWLIVVALGFFIDATSSYESEENST